MNVTDYSKLIDHCSLCIRGLKPANLFFIPLEYLSFFESVKNLLTKKDIYFRIICQCDTRAQILIYRKNMMETTFRKYEYATALEFFGYDPNLPVESNIDILTERIKHNKELNTKYFPNEIGLFLGYPPKDVLEFHKNDGENSLCSGYWKVYFNKEQALKTFNTYDHLRVAMKNKLHSGVDILKVFNLA